MICQPCRFGADLISCLTVHTPGETRVSLVAESRQQHSECTGCCCQHKVDLQVAGKAVAR